MIIKLQVTSIYTQAYIRYLLMWSGSDPEVRIRQKPAVAVVISEVFTLKPEDWFSYRN